MVKLALPTLFLLCITLLVHSFDLNFSTPKQCGTLQISWTGSPPAKLNFPLFIHILPFASNAVRAPIPNSVWNDSITIGSLTLPFNFSGGTQFLAAVVDNEGVGAGLVSQIITAVKAPDTSCLSAQGSSGPGHFSVLTTSDPSACPSLIVSWDGTVRTERPTVLAFSPGMLPVDLDPSDAAVPVNRIVQSVGNFTNTSQVVVLFDDNVSPRQTSKLLTVGGTDTACPSPPESTPSAGSSPTMMATGENSKNHAGLVVGAAAAAVVGVALIVFGIFAYRQRHERHVHGLIPHSRVFNRRSSTTEHSFLPSMTGSPPVRPRSPTPPPPEDPRTSTRPLPRDKSIIPLPLPPAPPTPPIKSPPLRLTQRRSYVSAPSKDTPSPQYMTPISNGGSGDSWNNEHNPLPDSATLPDPTFSRQLAEPTMPVTPRSAGRIPHTTARGGTGELLSPSSPSLAKKVI